MMNQTRRPPSLDRPFIGARNLWAGYAEKEVLRGLNFEIPWNRTTAVLGPGGSGKTTLLRLLKGLGRGHEVWFRGSLEVAEETNCWMPQTVAPCDRSPLGLFFHDDLNAAWPFGRPSPKCRRRILAYCENIPVFGSAMAQALDCPISSLPVDLVRAIWFSALLFRTPKHLIFDEPEAGFDPAFQAWMIQKLDGLRGKLNILLATHNLRMARQVSDLAILLIDGKIVEQGDAEAFFSKPFHPRTKHFVRMGA